MIHPIDHLRAIHDRVEALSNSATDLRTKMEEVFPPERRPAMAEAMSLGLHSPSHYIHEIEDLTEKVTHLNTIISGLKSSVSSLTGEVSKLTDKVSDLTGKLSDLKNDVVGKAKDIEQSIVGFWDKMKDIVDDFSLGAPELKQFKALLKSYFDIAMDALKSLLKTLGSDISSLVNIDRLKRIWATIGSVFEFLPKVAGMVISMIEDAANWGKTALEHVESKWKSITATTKAAFLGEVNDLNATLEQISGEHLSADLDTLIDLQATKSAIELLEVIPESLWHKATAMLQLSFFSELKAKAGDLLNALKANGKQKIKEAMAILIALCKSMKSWLRLTRQTFKVQINGKLLDYLKAKITGGGDFGAADADVDSDAGTGLTLGIDVYSISGAAAGLALFFVEAILAVVHLLGALY